MSAQNCLPVALLIALIPSAAHAASFTIDRVIGPDDLTFEGQPIEVRNCTLSIGGQHAFESLHVVGTGRVTVVATDGDSNRRVHLTISGDVQVDADASITVNALGYPSATGPGVGVGGAGGGHGGLGGMPVNPYGAAVEGPAYGDMLAPTSLGSGGGSGYNAAGGAGGGAIRLAVGGTLTVDGSITADGSNGSLNMQGGSAGGGSGGSIYLTSGTFAGNGAISANGGASPGDGGAGGAGGRIAIYAAVDAFTGTLTARGGTGAVYGSGGAGTIHQQTAGQTGRLLVDNANVPRGSATPIQSPAAFAVTLANGAMVYPTAALEISSLTIASNAALTTLPGQPGLDLTVLSGALIDATSRIDVSGKGFAIATGPGAGGPGGGGGHGGEGGRFSTVTVGGEAYDSFLAPAAFGSGGGNAYASEGGAGGGAIRMVVGGALQVDGRIAANGANAVLGPSGGGGAGGALHLTVGSLVGTGTIVANGGSSVGQGYGYGGGGAGGRIALYADTWMFGGVLSAYPGTGQAQPGGAGTIYRKLNGQSVGDLLVDADGIVGAPTPLASPEAYRVVMANRASAYAMDELNFGSLHLGGNSLFTHLSNQPALVITVQEDLVVEAGSTITATGKGFEAATGPGAGGYGGGGGGHGGPGGSVPNGGAGGPVNGSASEPVLRGSGGGAGYASVGGTGGGAIRLKVGGVFDLNGELSADGLAGGANGGGGAGGSIWVTTDTLTGTGSVRAQGGSSINGGGGGGGRIVLAADHRGTFSGTAAAIGGAGGSASGLVGTTHLNPKTMPVVSMALVAGNLEFNWATVDGLTYQLQSSPTLDVGSWRDEGAPHLGTGLPLFVTLPAGPEARRFYRLDVRN